MNRYIAKWPLAVFAVVVLGVSLTGKGGGDDSDLRIRIPDEIVDALGAGKRPPVVVTINGASYRSTVAVMGGSYMVGVSAENRALTGVAAGDEVQAGDVVAVLEAMKMLHSLQAAGRGVVADVRVAVGDLVQTNQVLVTFEEHPA